MKNIGIIGTIGLAISLALSGCSSGPTQLEEAYKNCGEPYGFYLEDDGKTLSFADSEDAYSIVCVLDSLDAPEWFWTRFGNTTTMDGWQEGGFGDFTIEWEYDYEHGASAIFKENREPR